MTKKNYIRIAEALSDTLVRASDSQLSYIIIRNLCTPWIDYLALDNPRFDPKRFIEYVWECYGTAMGLETVDK